MLELQNVLAMKCIESRMAVLYNSTDSLSVALHTVDEAGLILSEPRIYQLYTCKQSTSTGVVSLSQFAIITSTSFHQKSSNQSSQYSSGILDISDELFNVMFGFELNLCRCPVLLLPGHSGLVLWLAMKSIIGKSAASVQVLCSLGDNLFHAFSFSSVRDDGALMSSNLLLIGRHGHILVVSLSSGATMPSYQHLDILGPVHCCTFFDESYLLYSTGNELYIASLGKSVQSGQSGSVKSSALGISGVTTLSSVHSSEKNKTTVHGKLSIL